MPYLPLAVEGYRLPAIDSVAISPAEPRKLEAAIGQAMHRMLEWAQAGDTAIPDAQRDAAAREWGLDATEAARAAALAQAVRHGEGRWVWDDALLDWQGNEVPISHLGQPLRIDRLVRRKDSGEWWVLDYKSAGTPERQPELVAQLQSYRAAVQAAFPGEPVLAAFLTGRGTVAVVDALAAVDGADASGRPDSAGMPDPSDVPLPRDARPPRRPAASAPDPGRETAPPAEADAVAATLGPVPVPLAVPVQDDPMPSTDGPRKPSAVSLASPAPAAPPPPPPAPPTPRRKPTTPPPPAPPSAQGDLFS